MRTTASNYFDHILLNHSLHINLFPHAVAVILCYYSITAKSYAVSHTYSYVSERRGKMSGASE
jgi:hypothetical protein